MKLTARLALPGAVVVGQLWDLSVVANEWTKDDDTAWWGANLPAVSFLVLLVLWSLDPKDR